MKQRTEIAMVSSPDVNPRNLKVKVPTRAPLEECAIRRFNLVSSGGMVISVVLLATTVLGAALFTSPAPVEARLLSDRDMAAIFGSDGPVCVKDVNCELFHPIWHKDAQIDETGIASENGIVRCCSLRFVSRRRGRFAALSGPSKIAPAVLCDEPISLKRSNYSGPVRRAIGEG